MKYLICLILWFWGVNHSVAGEALGLEHRLEWEYQRMLSVDTNEMLALTANISNWYLCHSKFQEAYTETSNYAHIYEQHQHALFGYAYAVSSFFVDSFQQCERIISHNLSVADTLQMQQTVLRIYALNYIGDWGRANALFDSLSTSLMINPLPVDSLYLNAHSMKVKNPKTARLLSTILPGLGQTYAGKPGKGALSFLLTGLSVGYATFHVITGFYVTATLTGGLMFLRFYQGSRQAAVQYSFQFNEDQKRHMALQIIELQHQILVSSDERLNLLRY